MTFYEISKSKPLTKFLFLRFQIYEYVENIFFLFILVIRMNQFFKHYIVCSKRYKTLKRFCLLLSSNLSLIFKQIFYIYVSMYLLFFFCKPYFLIQLSLFKHQSDRMCKIFLRKTFELCTFCHKTKIPIKYLCANKTKRKLIVSQIKNAYLIN